jgi:hypothetical protein
VSWPIVIAGHLGADGQIRCNKKLLRQLLHGRRECEVELIIRRAFATRSTKANAFYWGVVLQALADHTGHLPEELHEILKAKFLPKALAVCDLNGELRGEYVIGGSTASLSVEEFSDYMNRIIRWADEELGVLIPHPDSEAA